MSQMNNSTKSTGGAQSRFGKASRFLLIGGILLVIAAGIFIFYQQQANQQAALSKELAALKKQVTASSEKQQAINAEIAQMKEGMAEAELQYASVENAPEILEKLIALAKNNGVEVTSTRITSITKQVGSGREKLSYPALEVQLGLSGQVSKFQNFLFSIAPEFTISEIKKVRFDIAQDEKTEDTASIAIDIYCLDRKK